MPQPSSLPQVGIVDLILDEPNGPVTADFKTAARNSESVEIVHEIQLLAYAYLFRYFQQRQETTLQNRSLVKSKITKIEFHRYLARTEARFRRLFAVVWEYLDAVERGRFNYRPGFGCAKCEFRQPC